LRFRVVCRHCGRKQGLFVNYFENCCITFITFHLLKTASCDCEVLIIIIIIIIIVIIIDYGALATEHILTKCGLD
jgi:uncharacterized membrane protein YobD (UPF0266 family)